MSERPSPLKSPTCGIEWPSAKLEIHGPPVLTNFEPLDAATWTWPYTPRLNEATSSRPSLLKSPTSGIELPEANRSCHLERTPKLPPVESET